MSDEVDSRHGIEKAAMATVLNRAHVLAVNIANELRNKKPEHFVDTSSLADIYYSLEHVADVLSTAKGSHAAGRDAGRKPFEHNKKPRLSRG